MRLREVAAEELRKRLPALDRLPEFGRNLRHNTSHERRYMHLFVRVRLHRTGNANINAEGRLDDLAKLEVQPSRSSAGIDTSGS